MTTIKASQIVGRDHFEYSGEFYFLLHLAKELERRGGALDMTGMALDWKRISDEYKTFYNLLRGRGAVISGADVAVVADGEFYTDINIDYMSDFPLFRTESFGGREVLHWSSEYASKNYPGIGLKLTSALTIRYYVFQTVAFHFAESLLTDENRVLEVRMDKTEMANFYIYDDLLLCLDSIDVFRDMVVFQLMGSEEAEVDLYLHFHKARQQGTYKTWTLPEKQEQLVELGFKEGAILHLWERKGVRRDNKVGSVPSVYLVRVDKVTERKVTFSKLTATKTIEELMMEWEAIDEDARHGFGSYEDVVRRKPVSETIDILSLGLNEFFYDENYLLTEFDRNEEVEKPLTVDGRVVWTKLNTRKMFYIMLNQWGIDFDRDMYVEMYLREESKSQHFTPEITTPF